MKKIFFFFNQDIVYNKIVNRVEFLQKELKKYVSKLQFLNIKFSVISKS